MSSYASYNLWTADGVSTACLHPFLNVLRSFVYTAGHSHEQQKYRDSCYDAIPEQSMSPRPSPQPDDKSFDEVLGECPARNWLSADIQPQGNCMFR